MLEEDFFDQRRTFSIGGGLFSIGVGLFLSPTVTEKSPPPTGKSPTAIPKRCWTLEYSVELEFSSPFMEQWTLDAGGVLCVKKEKICTGSGRHVSRGGLRQSVTAQSRGIPFQGILQLF